MAGGLFALITALPVLSADMEVQCASLNAVTV
jgi:hypothetical protein